MSIFSDLTGRTQARAIRSAGAAQERGINRAIDSTTRLAGESRRALEPWMKSGADASEMLSSLFQPGGRLTKTYGDYKAEPFKFDVMSDPGAVFRMEQANRGFERSAAARGRSLGAGAIRDIQTFNQALASDEYGRAFDRFNTDRAYGLTEHNTNRDAFEREGDDLFSRLFGISGQGQNAASTIGAQNASFGASLNDLFTGLGSVQAGSKVGAANARAQGTRGLLDTAMKGGALASLFI